METIPVSIAHAVRDFDGDIWVQFEPGEQWNCVTSSGIQPAGSVNEIEQEFGLEGSVVFVGPAVQPFRVGTECCEHCGAMGHSRNCPVVVGDVRDSAERSDPSKSSCGSAEERSDDPSKSSDLGEVS